MLPLFRHDDPDVGAVVPGASPVVPEHGVDAKSGSFELARHLPDRERAERQVEAVLPRPVSSALDILLLERREVPLRILADRLDERELRAAGTQHTRVGAVRQDPKRHLTTFEQKYV